MKELKGKQGRVIADLKQQTTPRRPRASKAVDEDLYKIPPELLCQKPKRVYYTLIFALFLTLSLVRRYVCFADGDVIVCRRGC